MYRGAGGRGSDMGETAALISLATSVPPYQFHQNQVLAAARDVLADRYPEFETLSSLFANTGIRHRYGVKPMEWYLERRGWPERTAAFLEGAEALFIDVAVKAIARAGLVAADIDTVVSVSSTGIATPTLEALRRRQAWHSSARMFSRVPGRFGLALRGRRVGAVDRLRGWRRRGPAPMLLLVAHLNRCTLAVRHDELTKANIVAASLFGDGAAAGGAARRRWRRHPDRGIRREAVAGHARCHRGWSVDPRGISASFSSERFRASLPNICGRRWPRCCRGIAGAFGIDDIDRFICHPRRDQGNPRPGTGALAVARARSTTSATSSPTTATAVARRPFSSCSNVRARRGCRRGRC